MEKYKRVSVGVILNPDFGHHNPYIISTDVLLHQR